MNYKIIGSGSSGNAVVINDAIMIDCGVSFKALREVYRDIKIVLLTHIHGDHYNKTTVRKLAKERPTLRFACCKWLAEEVKGIVKRVDVVEVGKIYNYGSFKISPIKLYHDVPNCGYRIFIGDKKLLYATDTSTMQGIKAENYDLYMIERNYEESEILDRISRKESKGEFSYEKRAMHNHLSEQQCNKFLVENAGEKSEFIYMHMHRGE